MIDVLRNARGERLDFCVHPGRADSDVLVVIGHGVTANKDRPFLVTLAEQLAEAGIAALRFSFAGNGASEGRFVDATITKEVDDLGAVLDAAGPRRLCYVGHSMGGAVGVLRARRDERIRWLVSLAGMVRTHEFAQRKFGDLVPGDSFMWDKPECPLSQAYMDDMARIGDVLEEGASLTLPWMLVHGTADTVVPIADSIDVQAAAGDNATLLKIDGADHLFSEHADVMAESVVGWLGAELA